MENKAQNAAEYINIIFNDEREKIVSETPIVYSEKIIERIYEFPDGAVVKYEWQSLPEDSVCSTEIYNHKFTLIETPSLNPGKIKKGIIKVINYPN